MHLDNIQRGVVYQGKTGEFGPELERRTTKRKHKPCVQVPFLIKKEGDLNARLMFSFSGAPF